MSLVLALIACDQPVSGPPTARAVPPRWTDITAGPCVIDEDGTIHCFAEVDPAYDPPPSLQAEPGDQLVDIEFPFVVTYTPEDGTSRGLHCPFEGQRCWSLSGSHLQVSAGDGTPLGILPSGHLDLSTTGGGAGFYDPEHQFQLLDGQNRGGLTAQNVLLVPGYEHPVSLDARPEAMVSFENGGGGGCILDISGRVTCVGQYFEDMPFIEGGWQGIDGSVAFTCAVRAEDDVIVCHDGGRGRTVGTFEWGPIRAFSARAQFAANDNGNRVCAITERNEIRCGGESVDDALLEQLDAINEERRTPLPPGLL